MMDSVALQTVHAALLGLLCVLCGVLAFCTSASTPRLVRLLLSMTPFILVIFLTEKISGAYTAYFFDVVLLGALIVYIVAVIILLKKLNVVCSLSDMKGLNHEAI